MSDDRETDERLTNLEMRYAFQERAIEQMSGEILRQQNQIDDLTKRIKEILNQINPGVAEKEIDEPPHY